MEFLGKYQHVKSENLDNYFKACEVPYLVRVMILKSNPEMEISRNEDVWSIIVKTLMRTITTEFKLGEEYTSEMPGAKLKCLTNLEDGKIVTVQQSEDGKHNSKSIYEFKGSYLLLTLIHEGANQEAKRYYKKLEK